MFVKQRSAVRLVAAVCVSVICLVAIGCSNANGDAPRGSAKSGGRPSRALTPRSAAGMGKLEVLKELVAQDPTVLTQTTGPDMTLLHVAAVGNQPEVIEYLVAKGLDIDARDATGDTPLHHAASRGSLAAAKTLVRLGADPTARSRAPRPNSSPTMSVLSAAALGGHPAMVEFLLEQGAPIVYGEADWKKEGSPKETALHWAMMGNTEWTDPQHSASPEYVLNQQADRLAVIDILARKIDDINTKATGAFNGGTPLHIAARHNQPPIVQYLLETYPEIDVNADDDFGNTPLHLVIPDARPENEQRADWQQRTLNSSKIIRLLIGHGAELDRRRNRDGETPLQNAIRIGDPAILEALGIKPTP